MGGNASSAVNGIGDLTVGCAGKMAIDSLEHMAQSSSTLLRKARVGDGWAIMQYPPKPGERFDAIEAAVIEGYKYRQPFFGPRMVDQ